MNDLTQQQYDSEVLEKYKDKYLKHTSLLYWLNSAQHAARTDPEITIPKETRDYMVWELENLKDVVFREMVTDDNNRPFSQE